MRLKIEWKQVCIMDSFGSGCAQRATSHENRNKPSASTKEHASPSEMRLTSPPKTNLCHRAG
jgi:hypothetical protein